MRILSFKLSRASRSGIIILCAVTAITIGITAATKKQRPIKKLSYDPAATKVELLDGLEKGELEATLIPKNSPGGNVFIENKTDKPITVKFTKAVAAAQILKQIGRGGRGGAGRMGGRPRGMGGGMGAGRGFRGFGVGLGDGGFGDGGFGDGGFGDGGFGDGGFGDGGYGGGTVAGNYMNGMANIIRADGEYNLLTSMAGVNNEEARSRYLDNKKKWWENYLQMSEQRSAIDAQRYAAAKHSPEALNLAARSALPRALGPDMLDPVAGHITWPEVLQDSQFADQRKETEQLLELSAKTGHGSGTSQKIRVPTAKMSEMLRKQVQDIPAYEYMAARKFLDSLDYAVHKPRGWWPIHFEKRATG